MLGIGSKAPDFRLKLTTGENFHLKDIYARTHVIVSFFPAGLTNIEKDEIHLFFQHVQKALTLGAVVVMVCPKDMVELQQLLIQNNILLPIVLDPTLEVCRNYHALWLRGVGLRRITYVIDKNGIIRGRLNHHLLTDKSWEPIIRLLQKLTTE